MFIFCIIWHWLTLSTVVPSNEPSDLHPHTLHNRHRPYNEPADMERYLTFREPHRIRYINDEGVCIHDEFINVKYEFSSVESSMQFQEDLRRKDLVDFYDTDVVWTSIHGRTDSFGNVRGVATLQRLKLWRDRLTGLYSLSIYQNKVDRQYRDYILEDFQPGIRYIDDRAKELRLEALRQDGDNGRQPVTVNPLRLRRRGSEASESRLQRRSTDSIRYLAIKFSERTGNLPLSHKSSFLLVANTLSVPTIHRDVGDLPESRQPTQPAPVTITGGHAHISYPGTAPKRHDELEPGALQLD